jgi:hypothetical protein
MAERRPCQPLPLFQLEAASTHSIQHSCIHCRISDYRDGAVVLGARPHHRRAADVDLLDRLWNRRTATHRVGERVQARHN